MHTFRKSDNGDVYIVEFISGDFVQEVCQVPGYIQTIKTVSLLNGGPGITDIDRYYLKGLEGLGDLEPRHKISDVCAFIRASKMGSNG